MLKAWPPSRVGPSASRAVADRADRTVRRVPVTNAPPHAAAAERHKMTAESNGRHIAAPCGGTATGARATINVRTRARPVPYRPTYPQCAPRTVAYGYDALPRGPHRHRAQPLTAGRPGTRSDPGNGHTEDVVTSARRAGPRPPERVRSNVKPRGRGSRR